MPGLAELPADLRFRPHLGRRRPGLRPGFYRRFGFRIYGSRAVRIDILERLADLIRPALAWSPAQRRAARGRGRRGRGFTVTPAMTSLLGASGEDFAVILKGLGYRMERRPKPAEPPSTAMAQPDAPQMATDVDRLF